MPLLPPSLSPRSFLSRLRRAPEAKRSRTASIAYSGLAPPRWTAGDARTRVSQAVLKNPIAWRAVRRVAEAVAEIDFEVTQDGVSAADHPAVRLLERPNASQDRPAFIETLAVHLLVAGNAYAEAVTLDEAPRELYALRPDRMRLVPGRGGRAAAYEYGVEAGETVRFTQEAAFAPILHLTLPHPFDDHYGVAPLEAAATAIDIHNAATDWTKALLDNAARPSGALIYSGGDGALSDDQYERLKRELEDGFAGARNAGRPLLLEGGLDWKPLAMTPKDMDFIAAKHNAAREIALAFGVPPIVLGIPGDATYANYQEANRAFYRETALPIARRVMGRLLAWLAPEDRLLAVPDEDRIGALHMERESLWARVGQADFLTRREKRVAVGYPDEPAPDDDYPEPAPGRGAR